MYETEANNRREEYRLPPDIAKRLNDSRSDIVERTLLPWGEHCTECVWPTCYTTCDLYSPRQDGRCRRFVDGMVRIDLPTAENSYLLKIRFKQWGKLWTPGNVHLHTLASAEELENRDERIAKVLRSAPMPGFVRSIATRKRYGFKKRTAVSGHSSSPELPSCFVVECYNPESRDIRLS